MIVNLQLGRRSFRSLIALGAALVAIVLSTWASFGSAPNLPVVNGKHVFWGLGAASAPSANNLIYHGGLVETTPSTYVVFWGPAWQNGFSFSAQGFTYTQASSMTYVKDLLNQYGGTPYAGIQTQYCQNIASGLDSCAGQPGAQFITNPTGQLKGTWIDEPPLALATSRTI